MIRKLPAVVPITVAVATLVTGCGFHGLYSTPLPGGANLGTHPMDLSVDFLDVLDLVPQSAVKVNDVPVGKVDSISLNGWTATVKIKVNSDVNLPKNARAELLQTSLLGEKYIALEQPTADPSAARLASGDTIPLAQTGRNPEVEEILGSISLVLSGGGIAQVQTILHELNAVFKGRTNEIKDLINQLNTFVGTLNAQKDAIAASIDNVDKLTVQLNAQKATIINTLDTMPQALQVLSDQRSQFVTLLNSLSNFGTVATNVLNQSTANMTADLQSLQPVLTQLSAAGANLPNSLDLLMTAPFPNAVTSAIKGDYLSITLKENAICQNDVTGYTYGSCALTTSSTSARALVPGLGS